MVSPHLRFREISGDPNAIVQAIPDTEKYIAAISSDPHSSRHGRGQLLLQVHKMEVDGSETLKLKLRLYDVDSSLLRLEAPAPSQAALLDCCFQTESVAFTAASDGSIIRYDLHSGTNDAIGNHQDIAACVGYSIETCQVISAGLDKKVMSWDVRLANPLTLFRNLDAEIESISVSGFDLMVAVGAAVNIYDLRKFERAVDLKESSMDVGIRCVASTSYTRGYAIGSIDGRVAVEISNPLNLNSIRYTFRCHPRTKDGKAHLVSVNDIAFNPLISGTFVTGDNEGYVTAWDAQSKRKLHEYPRYPNSVASLSYNHVGQLLAVASSYTYQEANETEVPPQIFIQKMDGNDIGYSPEVSRDSSRK
ncbi:hypothetical protein POTOM_038350 [Populus tomentosa]|uniref:Transducin/WD40 repeat-like superfamily protein n=1 Tax=Populus tomentosa TaxID=118781 RepID=A0A8X8CL96_POPTO|nr:hypothetical protein POTOM_038350 [Populus tomentosa]